PGFRPPWWGDPQGALQPPGQYRARLMRVGPDGVAALGSARDFGLRGVDNLPTGTKVEAAAGFQEAYVEAARRLEAVSGTLKLMEKRVRYLRKALDETP